MQVGTICTRQVITIDAGSTLAEAACRMRDHHVGSLVVIQSTTDGAQVVGIVTDRDLVVGAMTQPAAALQAPIETWARKDLVFLVEDDSLENAVAAMQTRGVRRLLVKDATGHLCGVLSIDDLLVSFAGHLAGLAGIFRSGLQIERGTTPSHFVNRSETPRFPGFGLGAWSRAVTDSRLP